MFQTGAIVALAIGYVCALFAVAWAGDRMMRSRKGTRGRPFIYAMTLGVYCTSWTFFGSVGLAGSTGYDFIPVYLGPILMFAIGTPLLVRIVRLSKSQNLTSVADFLAARYGKSPAVAAIVTVVSVVGTLPYIALQLKAIVTSTEVLLGNSPLIPISLPQIGILETAFVVALALALFAVLFGTRHIDATEHQHGLMLAVAAESLVKLAAFLTVGIFVLYSVFGGITGFAERAKSSVEFQALFGRAFNGGTWLTVMFLSFVCVILLPRQFHVTVVENHSEREIKRAAWMFPLYLVLINLFVVPIAAAGLLTLPTGLVDADMFVIALPMSKGADIVTTLAYVGGLSAATAMVIVESVALSIMICNGLVVPILLRRHSAETDPQAELAGLLLVIRRIAIFAIVLAGYLVHRALGQSQGLAAIGLVSFAAIAQLAPAFFFGLIWTKGTARGAIAGILAGITVWAYTLLLPWVVKAGWLPASLIELGPFGIAWLKPQALLLLKFEPLTHGVIWSMAANVTAYLTVSLLRPPEPVERLQAHLFVEGDQLRTEYPATPIAFRLWRTSITIGDLQAAAARYLGAERAERSFAEYAATQKPGPAPRLRLDAEADVQFLRFTERLLTSAIGAASARLVLALLLRRSNVGSQTALRLLDDASEALQYNRDLLQSALDQVRHGLGVFDKDMQLICWNRQFKELLDLPDDMGRVGTPMYVILKYCADRGDFGPGATERLVADRMAKLSQGKETFLERTTANARILEIRTAAMPQGGIVATYSDITDRVAAANALAAANESLERRVAERTAELTAVNVELAVAKAKADEANLDKTRFLAAASHDLLQPLNAARLYAASLVERAHAGEEAQMARNIDTSLSSVEEILSALIDLSRMDSGRLEPEITAVSLAEILQRVQIEFEPMARARGLDLRVVATSAWVMTDRRLLRRLLQNLVSNALKYTSSGGVLVGVRRRGARNVVQVIDTGPGIAEANHALIFKEFQRLNGPTQREPGLGLGLSIVERIGRVLDVEIGLRSKPGAGATFWVALPATTAAIAQPAEISVLQPMGSMAGLVVVCIDNEPAVLDGMRTLLTGWGCTVATAADGASAIINAQALGAMPDVILADYQLDEDTGLDAIAQLRSTIGGDPAGVIITANHSPEVQKEVRTRGLTLMRKPLKAATLRAYLMQVYLRRQAAAE
jgi:Na+/proline symporter/signal transduction histidine kinase/CheY-like chemotaxis protein